MHCKWPCHAVQQGLFAVLVWNDPALHRRELDVVGSNLNEFSRGKLYKKTSWISKAKASRTVLETEIFHVLYEEEFQKLISGEARAILFPKLVTLSKTTANHKKRHQQHNTSRDKKGKLTYRHYFETGHKVALRIEMRMLVEKTMRTDLLDWGCADIPLKLGKTTNFSFELCSWIDSSDFKKIDKTSWIALIWRFFTFWLFDLLALRIWPWLAEKGPIHQKISNNK